MNTKSLLLLMPISLLLSADTNASKQPIKPRTQEVAASSRTVPYSERDVITIRTKVRYATLIKLPAAEKIVEATCGDKEFWPITASDNIAHIKPAKVGAQTNLNLMTTSGNIYSFSLVEVSEDPQAQPDLKIFVEPKDDSMLSASSSAPKFVPARDVDEVKQRLAKSEEEVKRLKDSSQAAIDAAMTAFIRNVRFPYAFAAGQKPFNVRAMYTDDKFTYIQARPEETPAVYELRDGKPNLINFEYRNGLYVIGKIIGDGYMAIGRQKLKFTKQD